MELQVVLIGAVVFVISAVLIYLISAFTMKEKTFEEVIAEQKRQQQQEEQKVKQEKKAEKDHIRKRKRGKEKTKGDQSPKVSASDSEVKEHKMVNIELEPEIIEPVEAEKPLKINKKKDKPAKPILHNREEKTPVVPEEYVEEIVHRGPPPKDDFEMKLMHEAKKDKPKKEKNKRQEQPQQVVEEVMEMTESKVQCAAAPGSFSGKAVISFFISSAGFF